LIRKIKLILVSRFLVYLVQTKRQPLCRSYCTVEQKYKDRNFNERNIKACFCQILLLGLSSEFNTLILVMNMPEGENRKLFNVYISKRLANFWIHSLNSEIVTQKYLLIPANSLNRSIYYQQYLHIQRLLWSAISTIHLLAEVRLIQVYATYIQHFKPCTGP
jgi:hypothetical protein